MVLPQKEIGSYPNLWAAAAKEKSTSWLEMRIDLLKAIECKQLQDIRSNCTTKEKKMANNLIAPQRRLDIPKEHLYFGCEKIAEFSKDIEMVNVWKKTFSRIVTIFICGKFYGCLVHPNFQMSSFNKVNGMTQIKW